MPVKSHVKAGSTGEKDPVGWTQLLIEKSAMVQCVVTMLVLLVEAILLL